jgi:hypothetical protein
MIQALLFYAAYATMAVAVKKKPKMANQIESGQQPEGEQSSASSVDYAALQSEATAAEGKAWALYPSIDRSDKFAGMADEARQRGAQAEAADDVPARRDAMEEARSFDRASRGYDSQVEAASADYDTHVTAGRTESADSMTQIGVNYANDKAREQHLAKIRAQIEQQGKAA